MRNRMKNERAIEQIQEDINSLRDSISWKQKVVDKALKELTEAKMKIDELKLNIKNQEATLELLLKEGD